MFPDLYFVILDIEKSFYFRIFLVLCDSVQLKSMLIATGMLGVFKGWVGQEKYYIFSIVCFCIVSHAFVSIVYCTSLCRNV